jgi:hypothetical protein
VCSPDDTEATAQSNSRGPFAPSAQLRRFHAWAARRRDADGFA